MLEIETDDSIFEVSFFHVQFNITSACNMKCIHCRGEYGIEPEMRHMQLEDFLNLMRFSSEHLNIDGGGYLISGGEPLLHPKFRSFLEIIREFCRDNEYVSITSNGTLINENLLDFLDSLAFPDLRVSISLDSADEYRHNTFRRYKNAYGDAIKAIQLIGDRDAIKGIVRASIQQDQIKEVESIVDLVSGMGAQIVSFSSILPVGGALIHGNLGFSSEAKHDLITLVQGMNSRKKGVIIDVNDPLAHIGKLHGLQCGEYGGCIAGIGGFSVEANGTMNPCPVMPNQIIGNINGKKPDKIAKMYTESLIIHNLLERRLSGKCGSCENKFACGGCRARAQGVYDNYLAEDPDCWI